MNLQIAPFDTIFYMFFQSEKSWWNARIWVFFAGRIIFITFFFCLFFWLSCTSTHIFGVNLIYSKNVVPLSMKTYFIKSETSHASACYTLKVSCLFWSLRIVKTFLTFCHFWLNLSKMKLTTLRKLLYQIMSEFQPKMTKF